MDEKQTPTRARRVGGGLGLLAVQSISCAVVLLAVLILRLVGGGVFAQLGAYFEEAMQQNTLTAAIRALWEEDVAYSTAATTTTTASTTTTTTTTTAETTTGETTATAALTAVNPTTAPLSGAVVTSSFGPREDPFSGEAAFHSGIDLAAAEGTAIVAMWAGEVTAVDNVGTGSLGKYVTLRHADGVEVCCAHCSEVFVAVGDTVAAGQAVAAVGQTGRATGPHLHLEIRQNGVLCDPAAVLPGAYV